MELLTEAEYKARFGAEGTAAASAPPLSLDQAAVLERNYQAMKEAMRSIRSDLKVSAKELLAHYMSLSPELANEAASCLAAEALVEHAVAEVRRHSPPPRCSRR